MIFEQPKSVINDHSRIKGGRATKHPKIKRSITKATSKVRKSRRFLLIKNFDPICKCFYRWYGSGSPLVVAVWKWLPLVVAVWKWLPLVVAV